jgi:ribosomal 30S subunit maturation factor RimM
MYGYLNPEEKIVMLGITNWQTIKGFDRLKYYTNTEENYINYNPYEIDTPDHNENKKLLDPYHTHFLLIDSRKPDEENERELINGKKMISRERQNYYREKIEKKLVERYKIPIIR